MTEKVDLDALEALAKAAQERPDFSFGMVERKLRQMLTPSTVLALIAELRQERERADEVVERCMGHFVKHRNRAEAAEAALSRAEED